MFKLIFLISSFIFLFSGCSDHDEHDTHQQHVAHWGYTGQGAPAYWGGLKKEFETCSKGQMQSPIDIVPTQHTHLSTLHFDYISPSTTIVNNGHTVQVNVASGNLVTINNKEYELKQFHFHSPSENTIKGEHFPLEAHFVYQSYDGHLAVIALMFTEARENSRIKKIWEKLPTKSGQEMLIHLTPKEMKQILPHNKSYYKFMGSLTTPPCTQGVQWIVLKTPMTASKEQIEKFFNIFKHSNNRPVQATNSRAISE